VYIYVDAAHAGWLGWVDNREGFADVMKDVLAMAGGPNRIRGFATNTSNYNALDGEWGKKLEPSTPTPNEYSYVRALAETMAKRGITDKGYIIDTSRNGVAESRTVWGNWCNIAKAGIGERPAVAPRPLLDAYFWIKPPGDSDGVADRSAARFDENCASADARADAPEAGQWFPAHLIEMMKAANPPL
jgi:cellulose 1,4-beta-cellobiosidase